MLHIILQLATFANFAYAIYWDVFILKLPTQRSFGGQWKYLTFWNMWIQMVYFGISFLNNIFGTHATDPMSASKLQKIRDFFFATLAFPIGQFVGIVFWTLFYINRELVFPVAFDKFFPNYINHMMHTTVIPAQLLELVLLYHIYPSKKKGIFTTFFFCALYLSWTLVVAHVGGVWVYPIFQVLEPVPRAAFMLFCAMFGGLLYLGGELLNNIVWSRSLHSGGKSDYENSQPTRAKGKKPQKAE